jgi:DNA (cytosine-5)-methyltransferase 1
MMSLGLVLSLFPGADLLGDAFAEVGFTVVRGPDLLFGSDVRDFHVPPHRFDGVIGGPPCQVHSGAAITGTDAIDLIPEFVRLVQEAQPSWAVMENVVNARYSETAPDWSSVLLNDWDCGGMTARKRAFWFYGIEMPPPPITRAGQPERSVLASSWNMHYDPDATVTAFGSKTRKASLKWHDAGRLQGWPDKAARLAEHLARRVWLSDRVVDQLTVHMLGNGVPRAMGLYVARHVQAQIEGRDSLFLTGLPLFAAAESEGA